MAYVFVEPLPLGSLLLFFISSLIVIIYLVYYSVKRKKILDLKKIPTVFIVGLPNSGRTSIMRELSNSKVSFLDKTLNLSYMNMVYDGKMALKIVDYQGIIYNEGRLNDTILNDMKAINPKCIIAIIDVSIFAEHIENQIQFIFKIKEMFKNKKIFLVANKVDKTSKNKIRDIEKTFGKNIYKIGLNQPKDTEKLKKDIIRYLTKKSR